MTTLSMTPLADTWALRNLLTLEPCEVSKGDFYKVKVNGCITVGNTLDLGF